ncbi:unnamed protein product [Leptosia nina]|uniref:Uncharacterized protein n=1 Tax=Leptosia nina TaxID=320188 RepID=A0AAV1J0I5_9NEOP
MTRRFICVGIQKLGADCHGNDTARSEGDTERTKAHAPRRDMRTPSRDRIKTNAQFEWALRSMHADATDTEYKEYLWSGLPSRVKCLRPAIVSGHVRHCGGDNARKQRGCCVITTGPCVTVRYELLIICGRRSLRTGSTA